MIPKKYFVLCVFIIYAVLITLFIKFERKDPRYASSFRYGHGCGSTSICMRFCCKNETLCDKNYIKNNFKLLHLAKFSSKDVRPNLREPQCTLKLVDNFEMEKIDRVSRTQEAFYYDVTLKNFYSQIEITTR